MPALQTLILLSLASIALCASGCLVLIAMLYRHYLHRERTRLKETRLGIADMAILFQTMRDIIAQQKNLARDFNKEVDRKTGQVKTILARGLEKNEKLYEQQQALTRQIEEARAQLQSIQRQIGYVQAAPEAGEDAPLASTLEEASVAGPSEAPAPVETRPVVGDERPSSPETTLGQEPGALTPSRAVGTEPSRADLLSAAFAEWAETEAETPIQPEPTPTPVIAPETPEDSDAARQAFRALLDMEAPSGPANAPAANETAFADAGGNGRKNIRPLQKRVLEYSEAGMTVAQISRELGIGKGEVRLMLSLLQHKKA